MMGLGTKKSGMHQFYGLIENLLSERIQKEYDLGLVQLDAIHITDVKDVWYNFRVKHIIIKGSRKIKHTNTLTFFAKDIDIAKDLFQRKIKQLKHQLDSIVSIEKSLSGITTNSGDFHRKGSFELIKIKNNE